mgnify:CR=1 FL=1|jgi:hypothetical protein
MRHQNAVSTIAALAMSLLAVVGSQASALSYGDLVPISELQDSSGELVTPHCLLIAFANVK